MKLTRSRMPRQFCLVQISAESCFSSGTEAFLLGVDNRISDGSDTAND